MNAEYEKNGYLIIRNLFSQDELQTVRDVVQNFHTSWKRANADFYAEKAVNSAYLTAKEHLTEPERTTLFTFIGSSILMDLVASTMKSRPTFMNTQLFFNPKNKNQTNYWHRDPQYHLSIDEQKSALAGPEVIHCRIPLLDEPGIELVPGTHKRWDTDEEHNVRLEQHDHTNDESLSTGVAIALKAGDVLIFSANMIHRGLYGMDRLSFDILFCDPAPHLIKFVNDDCLPNPAVIQQLDNGDAFKSAIEIKAKTSAPLSAPSHSNNK